ncbi:MAG: hypothetical protein M3P95_12620 [Actinomycetota bacterium]|jgi:hypothetical protein|nr:hypothetical protein [Actinomycetota bacterium]
MNWFRPERRIDRRSDRDPGAGARPGSSDTQPDGVFPFLHAGEGRRLRAAVRAAFADRGFETTVLGDHVVSAAGVRFGLHNLAAACHAAPGGERDWPATIRAHVAAVLSSTSTPDALERGDREAVLRDVVLRVMGASTLPSVDWLDYARPLGGNLVEVLALDLPDTVHLLGDDDVARFGEDDLRAAGLANLLAQPYDSHEHLRLDGGGDLHVISGNSVYVASRLLVLPDLLRRTVGAGEAVPIPHGLLVSAATRHQLAFHVVRDAGVIPALQALVPTTAQEYAEGVGAVSPWVFWWHEGRFTQLSHDGDGDRLRVEVTSEFAEVLQEVLAPQ